LGRRSLEKGIGRERQTKKSLKRGMGKERQTKNRNEREN
jgi:hypothetical protein